MSPVTRRRVEKRTAELNRLRLTQENLLREAIRAEIRAYNHTNPLAGELVLYEGLWDSIKSAASKAAEFGREVAQDFKKGWERVSKTVSEALSAVTNEVVNKAKTFIDQLGSLYKKIKGKAKEFGEEKVRRFVSVFKDHHGDLHDESHKIAAESKTNGCVEQAIESLGDKAEKMDSDSPKVQMSMDEGRRMVFETHRIMRNGNRRVMSEARLLKESTDPLTVVMLGFGAVMLILKGMAAVLKFIGGPCSNWANSAAAIFEKGYNAMHHFEQAVIDTLVPDTVAAVFYDFYLFCGFAPVKGDPGRVEKTAGDETFGTPGYEESPQYKKGKLTGKIGSSRDTKVSELEDNDTFRREIKVKMYQIMLVYMLGAALWTIAKAGFSVFYGVKSAVKTGELGVAAAGEVSAAVRAARSAG